MQIRAGKCKRFRVKGLSTSEWKRHTFLGPRASLARIPHTQSPRSILRAPFPVPGGRRRRSSPRPRPGTRQRDINGRLSWPLSVRRCRPRTGGKAYFQTG
jgi:hypothetical protein